jgi:hypothetical protein
MARYFTHSSGFLQPKNKLQAEVKRIIQSKSNFILDDEDARALLIKDTMEQIDIANATHPRCAKVEATATKDYPDQQQMTIYVTNGFISLKIWVANN